MNLYVLGAGVAFVIALVAGAGFKGYLYGRESRESEVISLQTAIASAEAVARDAEERGKRAAAKAKADYAAKAKVIRIEAENRGLVETIRKEPGCDLSPSWRVLHDTAAGHPADASSAGTVGSALAAETVSENYRIARETAAKLEALQNLVREYQVKD